MFRSLLAATALTFTAACLTPAFADDLKAPRTMALSGHGEVRVAPEMAIVTVGALSQSATAADALKANTASMQAIFAILKEAGIEDKDIQTSNFTVQPHYDYNNNSGEPPRIVGYDVSNSVMIAVRKLDAVGALLDKVVSVGSNQISGIQYQAAKPDAALDEARKLAVAEATRKAKVYSAASSVQLGDILSITEGGGNQPPIVMQAKMIRAGEASDVPIAQGEQAISVDVNIVWEIN